MPRPAHRHRTALALALGAAAAIAAVATAAPPPPLWQTQIEIGKSRITVGSLIPVQLWVNVPEAARVEWPRADAPLGGFEPRRAEPPRRTRVAPGIVRESVRVWLATFDLGAVTLPGPRIQVVGPAGRREVAFPPAAVLVQSVLGPRDKARDIRDIKGPVGWRRPLPAWVRPLEIALRVLAVTALLAWLAWKLVRARKEAELRIPYPDRALRDLEALRRTDLLAQGRLKEFHIRLTEILRRYVGERCGFEALDLTSEEVLARVAGKLPQEAEPLRRILELSDLVKFARFVPERGASKVALDEAVALVERTRPREEAAA